MGMAGFTVALMMIGVVISPCVYGQEFSYNQEIEVQRLLKRLNKHALVSIKSEDGDIIDCVPIHSQLAFDHPLLINHTIQMKPSFIPESMSTYTEYTSQVWNKNGKCPENTVSIRRIKKEDILRSQTIKKMPRLSSSNEYATMRTKDGNYFGTKFVANIWKPVVQSPYEFSIVQTSLQSGGAFTRNQIRAGFQALPFSYNDDNFRLFIFWTADSYIRTGCYNTRCPGFVQTSNIIALDSTFSNYSQYGGLQIEIPIHIWKDQGNWWLMVRNEVVGYWPNTLFTSLSNGATSVSWGGEINNDQTGGRHTSTSMGSGLFAEEGYKKASYFRNIMTIDAKNIPKEPQGAYTTATNDNCYNIKAGGGPASWGVNFFYGGPGLNVKCP